MRKKTIFKCCMAALLVAVLLLLAGCGRNEKTDRASSLETVDDITDDVVFGDVVGSVYGDYIAEHYPNCTLKLFNSFADVIAAVESGKIDLMCEDAPLAEFLAASNDSLRILDGVLFEENYYFIVSKSDAGASLLEDFNAWLAEYYADGRQQALHDFWVSNDDPAGRIDYDMPAVNGTLRIGTFLQARPAGYLYNGEATGYPVEMAAEYCRDRGYAIEIVTMSLDAFPAALSSGKIDMYCAFMSYTDERAETMNFTDVVYSGGCACLTRETSGGTGESFFSGIASGFEKTFVREQRWKLVLEGLGVTMLITFGGFALANVFGAVFCALQMSKRKFCRALADIYSRLMQGTPVVVVLMIMYYIVFGSAQVSGIFVAIIAFGLSAGAGLAQLFFGAVTGVDRGQWEASYALGMTKFEAFTGIVFPQAARTALPGYFSTLISLMKDTAVVGYVAVIDLTKVSDIIRAGTFEAFFPLLSIAAIYLLIASLLLSVMKRIVRALMPKRARAKEARK